MLLVVIVSSLGLAASTFGEPEIRTPLPDEEHDEEVSDISTLRDRLANPTVTISLHITGPISFSQNRIVIARGMSVTLWGDPSVAVLDAVNQSTLGNDFPGVLDVLGKLYLNGVSVRGATRSVGWIGGCIRTQRDGSEPWLFIRNSRISGCSVEGGGGGGMLVLAGTAIVWDSAIENTTVISTNANTRGGGIGVQAGELNLRNVRFSGTRVETVEALAYGGGLAVWGTGRALLDTVTFTGCSATSVNFQAFGGGLGVTGGRVNATHVRFEATHVQSGSQSAFGGGLGMDNGQVWMQDAVFVDPRADCVSWYGAGGAIGLFGGKLNVRGLLIDGATAFSAEHRAFGGAVVVFNGGEAFLADGDITRANATSAHHEAFAGAVGVHMESGSDDDDLGDVVSFLSLANVRITDTTLAGALNRTGLVINVQYARLTTAAVHIAQRCEAEDTGTYLIDETHSDANFVLPLRNLR